MARSSTIDPNGRLLEEYVQDSFHSYLKSSLAQAKAEHLLDVDMLSSAEGDLMITGVYILHFFSYKQVCEECHLDSVGHSGPCAVRIIGGVSVQLDMTADQRYGARLEGHGSYAEFWKLLWHVSCRKHVHGPFEHQLVFQSCDL